MAKRWTGLAVVGAMALILTATPARAQEVSGHAISLQAGWWSADFEYRAPFGLFLDVGVPWFAYVLDGTMDGTDWTVAFGAKLGYQLAVSPSWRIRFGVRDAESIWNGCPCIDDTDETDVHSLISIEAGARYESEFGLVAGVDLSFYAVMINSFGSANHFWPGYSMLFSQAYLGYQWIV